MQIILVMDEYTSEIGKALITALHEEFDRLEWESTIAALDKEDTYEECLPFFLAQRAELVITADMAGFHMLDAKGETVYNSMYCRCLHILTQEPWYYPDELLKRMNFTAVVVTAEKWQKAYLERHYENILQVRVIEELKALASTIYEGPEQIRKRLKALPGAFADMAAELLKSWKRQSVLCNEIDAYLKAHKIPCTEDERIELCVLLKDVPICWQMTEGQKQTAMGEKENQPSDSLIRAVISLIREG